LEGDDIFMVDGLPAAFKGARVLCHVDGMTHIAEATARVTVHGRPVARQGDLLACGHHIVVPGERRATSDRYSDADDGYKQHMDSDLSKSRIQSSQVSGRVMLDNAEHPIDTSLEVELRLLCGRGKPHGGLNYVKTLAATSGTPTQSSPEGLTSPLSCSSENVPFVAIAVPDMEVW
jgi:hypothetical protein